MWPTIWEFFILPLQIHRVDWQAPSPGVVLLLLATTQIYTHGDYEPSCPFHGAQYQADMLQKNYCPKTSIENFK